jgi:hypothetical protein
LHRPLAGLFGFEDAANIAGLTIRVDVAAAIARVLAGRERAGAVRASSRAFRSRKNRQEIEIALGARIEHMQL